MNKRAYLSLGSNLGDRRRHLEDALALLREGGVTILRRSSFYETEPRDFVDQPWFLNLVVEVDCTLFPRQLLSLIGRIERRLGRRRTVHKGPRTIDIDILLFGNFVLHSHDLVIPHPRMLERRFVLAPLAELAPELRHPITRQTMRDALTGLTGQSVRKITDDHAQTR